MESVRNTIGGLGNLMFKEAYIYSQFLDGNIPDIYLQDAKYFNGYEKEIRSRFGGGIGYLPYVSIHVRRGDYVGSTFHTDLTETDYYERAISLFPDSRFLVFSDDTDWCCKRFSDTEKFLVKTNQTEIEDMNMMASCQNHIIANSSFSWWAAWLNPNKSKRVIALKESLWFRDGVIRTKVPSTWEQI